MSDVISERSASLDFAFVSAKIGTMTEDPPTSGSRGTTAWRSRGQRAEDPLRSPLRSGRGRLRAEGGRIADRWRLKTESPTTSMRLIMEDRAEMPNGKRL